MMIAAQPSIYYRELASTYEDCRVISFNVTWIMQMGNNLYKKQPKSSKYIHNKNIIKLFESRKKQVL